MSIGTTQSRFQSLASLSIKIVKPVASPRRLVARQPLAPRRLARCLYLHATLGTDELGTIRDLLMNLAMTCVQYLKINKIRILVFWYKLPTENSLIGHGRDMVNKSINKAWG